MQIGIPGEYGIRVFDGFQKIVNGEGKWTYQYFKRETFIDEESGNKYSAETETGWKLQDNYYLNEDIRERYKL